MRMSEHNKQVAKAQIAERAQSLGYAYGTSQVLAERFLLLFEQTDWDSDFCKAHFESGSLYRSGNGPLLAFRALHPNAEPELFNTLYYGAGTGEFNRLGEKFDTVYLHGKLYYFLKLSEVKNEQ